MSTLFQGHFVQFFDDNGDPLSGGEVDFYAPGTSTPKDVYTDADLSTPASNPVTLDSAGRATLWLNGDYKVRLKKSDGSVVRTTDNINPPADTETSSGNLVANGSFEDAGNSSTEADGWTLAEQSDGSVERITSDNYHGEAALKFTSDGSGGGQADTDAFFLVSPGRTYEVSFFLKCSVADIRNIVQVRYFDKDQQFLSNSTVYDEDTSNPTSWTLKSFEETPPANARFGKLRILGADQSDATAGEAKFDEITVRTIRGDSVAQTFPNVDANVTASDEELNKLDGYAGEIPKAAWFLIEEQAASNDSNLDFSVSGYSRYMFQIDRLDVDATGNLAIRTSADGGSSFYTSTSYGYAFLTVTSTTTVSEDTNGSEIRISSSSNSIFQGDVWIQDIGSADTRTMFFFKTSTNSRGYSEGSGTAPTTEVTDAVRFFHTGGNLVSGTIRLYGWRDGS